VQGLATADSYALDYMSLLAQLRQSRSDATLMVLTPIPVYTDGLYGMNATYANAFIPAQIRRIASLSGARLVDLSVEFGQSGGGKALTCDGVHPLPTGNAIIAKILAKHILAAVAGQ
jgi:lysophospholipase L1-like esterase